MCFKTSVLKMILVLLLLAPSVLSLEESRIVNGKNVTELIPGIYSLMLNGQHICGAVQFIQNIAITAAQCVYGIPVEELSVRIGSNYHDQDGTIHKIYNLEIHEKYNPRNLDNDQAIFSIEDFPSNVIPIAAIALFDNKINDGDTGVLFGWGKTQEGGALAEVLQMVELPVVNFNVCQNHYKRLTKTMFCAGYMSGLKGACKGDEGSPFIVNGILQGWYSFSYGCAQPNFPGVFTILDPSSYLIKKHLKNVEIIVD